MVVVGVPLSSVALEVAQQPMEVVSRPDVSAEVVPSKTGATVSVASVPSRIPRLQAPPPSSHPWFSDLRPA